MTGEAGAHGGSIRRRLVVSIAVVLVAVLTGAAIVTYQVALRVANGAYDRALLDTALALSQNVHDTDSAARLDLTHRALEALLFDEEDRLAFLIRGPGGRFVAGDPGLPVEPAGLPAEVRRFFDGRRGDEELRLVMLHADHGIEVVVGETLNKRTRLVREILVGELAPMLAIGVAVAALGWLAIARALRPLARIREDVARRSPTDLRPLDALQAPEEIRPAILAFNELLARLRQASEAQQRFLANAAHQLRTPLAGLQMQLELLLREQHTDTARDELAKMRTATERTTRLAKQLLALASAERSHEPEARMRTLDLHEIADEAARDWTARAIAADIDLGFDLAHASIDGDPVLLRELVNNLVDNALAYTPRGGYVTLRCGVAGGRPFLAVDDNGPGIAPEHRSRVLDRFYRIEGSPGEGSGLGLAIVREVADRHRADVAIENGSSGGGTCVTIRFPPAPVSGATPPREPASVRGEAATALDRG